MIRKQVYLSEDLDYAVKLRAKKQNKPEAQVLRDLLQKGIAADNPQNAGDTLLAIAKSAVRGAPRDLSQNIDKYLYEK